MRVLHVLRAHHGHPGKSKPINKIVYRASGFIRVFRKKSSIYLFADKMDNFLWLTMIMAAWITTTGVSTMTTTAATAEESSWSESYTSENTDEYLKSKENEMNLVSFCGLCITRNCSNLLISLNCTHLHFDKMFRFGCCFLYKRQLTDDLIHALSAFYTIAKTNQKSHFTQFCNEISVFFSLILMHNQLIRQMAKFS